MFICSYEDRWGIGFRKAIFFYRYSENYRLDTARK